MNSSTTLRWGLLVALVAVLGPGCEKKQAPSANVAANAPTKKQAPSTPTNSSKISAPADYSVYGQVPTDDECRKFGETLEAAIASGDMKTAEAMIDVDALLDIVTRGIDVPEDFRKGYLNTSKSTLVGDRFILGHIATTTKNGTSLHFLRAHAVDGQERAIFRLLGKNGGLNYFDFVLVRKGDGRIVAVDMYMVASGESTAQVLRRIYVQVVAEEVKPVVDKLTQGEGNDITNIRRIAEMARNLRAGRPQQALDVYDKLPESTKRDKQAMFFRIQAAAVIDEDMYAETILAFRKAHPHDPCLDFILVASYFINKEFDKARAALDRLNELVGGDPYLGVLRANSFIEEENFDEARQCAMKAITAEKTLLPAYDTLMTISLRQKDFGETARLLRVLETDFDQTFNDLMALPEYAEFVKSPQYAEWLKRKQPTNE